MNQPNPKFMKKRLIPYRVLVILLYSNNKSILTAEQDKVIVRTGPMSRSLRISISRLLDSFGWLEANGFITYDKLINGQYSIKIKNPRNINLD